MKQISKRMPYKSLIREHKNLVHVLKYGTKKQKEKLLREQSKELKEYQSEFKRKRRNN